MGSGIFKKFWALPMILVFSACAYAQQAPRENADITAPPVEQASFHQLMFANEDFAVLSNRYPPDGDSGFHTHYRDIFYVVIQSASSSGQRPGQPLTATVQIVDNERMRAWRLILEPGQSAPSISQGGEGVRVVVRGGSLTTATADVPDQTLFLHAGDFALQSSGSTRALRNTGAETIELIEIELK